MNFNQSPINLYIQKIIKKYNGILKEDDKLLFSSHEIAEFLYYIKNKDEENQKKSISQASINYRNILYSHALTIESVIKLYRYIIDIIEKNTFMIDCRDKYPETYLWINSLLLSRLLYNEPRLLNVDNGKIDFTMKLWQIKRFFIESGRTDWKEIVKHITCNKKTIKNNSIYSITMDGQKTEFQWGIIKESIQESVKNYNENFKKILIDYIKQLP